MKHRHSKKAKMIISAVVAFLLIAGCLAYVAADRFLIEHVEAAVSTAATGSASSGTAARDSAAADSTAGEYTATDTSYESGDKQIAITKVTTGSGADQVTYYVADIRLTDGTDLKSALAKKRIRHKHHPVCVRHGREQ